MKVIELLKIDQKVLEVLQSCSIRIDDVRYVELYEEFKKIESNGGKITYAVAYLSDKYGISERKVYYLINKLSKDCKVCAV